VKIVLVLVVPTSLAARALDHQRQKLRRAGLRRAQSSRCPRPRLYWRGDGLGALSSAAAINDPLDFAFSGGTLPILSAPVAQLDRASDYGSEGCVFESRRVQMLDWQGVKARNASQRQPPGGGNLSHF
jgi:hypothetical protein